MSKLWKKFRKTGEEQNILPPAPTGAVTAFAGSTIPGGWLDLAGGPYFASDYEALAIILGVTTASGIQYLKLPSIASRAPLGDFEDIADPDLQRRSGGATTAGPLTAGQSGVRAHTHEMGFSHNHSIDGATSHQHLLYTRVTASYNDSEPSVVINSNFPADHAFAITQTPRPPSFSSGTSTYGLTLNGAKVNASITSYAADAGNAVQSIYNYADTHTNLQPSLELIYLIKT